MLDPVSARAGSPHIGAVILAAGGSTRMGQPKQLLDWQGAPLVTRAVATALETSLWPIVLVLGNAADAIKPLFAKQPLQIVENKLWGRGIGSSIHLGVETLDRFSISLEGALVMLADQPHISAGALNALLAAFGDGTKIIAAKYSGSVGSPVLLPRRFFPELKALPPDVGAQRILKANANEVIAIDRPELAVDLDTPEDYQRLKKENTPG